MPTTFWVYMLEVFTAMFADIFFVGLSSNDSKGASCVIERLKMAVAFTFSPLNNIDAIRGLTTTDGTDDCADAGPKATEPFSDWFHLLASQLASVPKFAKVTIPRAPCACAYCAAPITSP